MLLPAAHTISTEVMVAVAGKFLGPSTRCQGYFARALASVNASWKSSPWRVIVLAVGQPQSGFCSMYWR